ncbi:MAG: AAA family ATPase, partial [Candidatus Peregrinibacteria bacterium]|nr:AAA family ATPase [Candidatus Peregrinibacteria bacterium]
MIRPNWDVFKAKFSDDKQGYFEWFCYLLFCKEFEKPFGIFRYKNQHAIETEPVGEKGWQAKFYDTSLTSNKDDILKTIKDAKKKYPSIKKLLFYTNQEWGQTNKGKKPQGKIDAENKAKELGIELEWRVASFFESSFVAIDNEIIAKHFFNLDNSALDLIEKFKDHNEKILEEIGTSISFKNKNIEIDQKKITEELNKSQAKAIILSGVGGVGKTAVIKTVCQNLDPKIPFYIFKGLEFETQNIDDLFPNSSLKAFLGVHKHEEQKVMVIDSAEKLLGLKNTIPFKSFLQDLLKDNWRLIFTTRENYLADLNYEFFEIYNVKPCNLRLENITKKDLYELSEKYK